MNKNEVNTAFEILLEEIEEIFNMISKDGEDAFRSQDFDKAKSLIEKGERLKTFRERVKSLQKEWQNIFSGKMPTSTRKKRTTKKLQRGLRTPEEEFKIPILESLLELGGEAEMNVVLQKVYGKMKDKLNAYDLSSLLSNPHQTRWENTAQWARNTMVNEGLISSESPRGVWEITVKGRQFYQENKSTG